MASQWLMREGSYRCSQDPESLPSSPDTSQSACRADALISRPHTGYKRARDLDTDVSVWYKRPCEVKSWAKVHRTSHISG
jgi:hypothetical protein